jgi:exodeoxyribonuclease VII large subunit
MSGNGFFDVREKLVTPRRAAASPASAPASAKPLTVTQITRIVDRAIAAGVPVTVVVQGEVSNFNFHRASGHAYFTLKDASACLSCVMFRDNFSSVQFKVVDGLELIATGNVRVFPKQGRHQLYIDRLQPLGQGALELAFQQLRSKLEAEGLFHADRKRPVPRYPRRIVLMTSRQGAAVQDMLKVLRRFPWIELLIYHVPVQGDGCGQHIAAAITHLNRRVEQIPGGVDLILLGRGGGSLEDLWGFNDETLARAIVASRIPIVTGIGHEVDTSIADLVADHHAHTPTEAATFVTLHWQSAANLLVERDQRLQRQAIVMLQHARQRLIAIERHEVFRRPTDRIDDLRMTLDDRQRALLSAMKHRIHALHGRVREAAERLERQGPAVQLARVQARVDEMSRCLTRGMETALRRRRDRIDAKAALLEAVSPQRVLQRGYSLTRVKRGGAIVRSAEQVKEGDRILTRFVDGEVESVVEDAKQQRLFE